MTTNFKQLWMTTIFLTSYWTITNRERIRKRENKNTKRVCERKLLKMVVQISFLLIKGSKISIVEN